MSADTLAGVFAVAAFSALVGASFALWVLIPRISEAIDAADRETLADARAEAEMFGGRE